MKKLTLALILTASALLAGNLQAQVNIHITGAAAFRGQTYNSIRNLYDPGYSQNPASGSTASLVTWSGTISNLFGAQTVNIYANYNGAVAGVQNLTLNTPASFLSSATPPSTATFSAVADLAFSSVYQKSTAYTTPVLNDNIFGVTPVLWLKSTNAPAALTNITAQQVKELASNGALPASYFTGNTNDTSLIYFVTRDVSAGQRVIVFKDSGFSGSPLSYTNNGTVWNYDPAGQTATGTIVSQLNNYGPAISYLTGVDAINVTNGAVLAYNGVLPFKGTSLSSVTNDFTPTITGQYSLWGYEHILSRTTASGNVATFLTNLTTQISSALGNYPYTIPLSKVGVGRDSDGGLVYPLQ